MNKIATSSLVGLSALMLAATDLSAQLCNGTASFAAGRMRVGAGVNFTDGASAYGAEFAFGMKSGLYAGVNVATIDYDGITEGATTFGVDGGKSILIGKDKKVEMCPQLAFSMSSGPDFGATEVSGTSLGAGVSFGTKVDASKSFELLPFGAFMLRRENTELTNGATTTDGSDTNSDIALGAGFIFSKRWTVRPSLMIPLGQNGADPWYGVLVAMSFGKP